VHPPRQHQGIHDRRGASPQLEQEKEVGHIGRDAGDDTGEEPGEPWGLGLASAMNPVPSPFSHPC
jgi:hypothetical protein